MIPRDYISTPETTVEISKKLAYTDTKNIYIVQAFFAHEKIFQP